ncbi:MAG: VWA domain-containing protein, partial [Acidobacteria bacterium]|nr:VWA domain-containing protein [Acidobacteriota bacterium]
EEPAGSFADAARRTSAAEVSTNRGAPRGHLYMLIFDQQHLASGNEQSARKAAERFLRTRVRPGDRVALYAIPGPGPQIDFTGNVERAIAELPKVRGSLERLAQGSGGAMRVHEAYEIGRANQEVLTRVTERLSQQQAGTDALGTFAGRAVGRAASGGDDGTMFRSIVQEDARGVVARADEAARRFLTIFADVIRQVVPVEGRKTVILFSEGFYADRVTREIEQVAAAAALSYTVIYSVDLNRRQIDLREDEPVGGELQAEIESRLTPLGSLAAETDGLLLHDAAAHADAALARIGDLSQEYYIVGFSPPPGDTRASTDYRRVSVRVRRPGTRVSARTGYAPPLAATPADRRRAIDTALRAPYPQQGLPVRYTTYVMRGSTPGAQKVFVSAEADLPIAGAASSKTADVVFVVRGVRDGRVIASGTDVMPLPDTPAPGASVGTGTYKVQFDAPAGEYVMRIVVREPGGLLGSADRRFDVRALDGPDVGISDLILGDSRGALPVRATAYVSDALSGLLELHARTPVQLENVGVTLELARIGGDTVATSVQADVLEPDADGARTTRTASVMLPLEHVEPGDYIARAVVRQGADQVGAVVREVRVVEGNAPVAHVPRAPIDPIDVLGGEIARRYVQQLREATAATPHGPAGAAAANGDWQKVRAVTRDLGDGAIAAAWALRGLSEFAGRAYGPARSSLKRAFDTDPRQPLAAFFLGWAHASAGELPQAITAWRNAVYLDASLVPAHLALADAYLDLAQPALAIQVLRAGLSVLPASPELRDHLSRIEKK